jgi:hypothetical protein
VTTIAQLFLVTSSLFGFLFLVATVVYFGFWFLVATTAEIFIVDSPLFGSLFIVTATVYFGFLFVAKVVHFRSNFDSFTLRRRGSRSFATHAFTQLGPIHSLLGRSGLQWKGAHTNCHGGILCLALVLRGPKEHILVLIFAIVVVVVLAAIKAKHTRLNRLVQGCFTSSTRARPVDALPTDT